MDLTPARNGMMMPAEWAHHSGCLISWPCNERTWHGQYERAKQDYEKVIAAVHRLEPVTVLADPATGGEARRRLGDGHDIVEVRLDDSWIRDNGPIFVKSPGGGLAMVDFRFNGWGNKTSYDSDDKVPATLSEVMGVDRYIAPLVLEGGGISVDGEGTLLTTEQCLLNENRNPSLSKAEVERHLMDYLGVGKVIWLGRGQADDITDGHVDGVACFASPRTVIAARTDDDSDPNYESLEENIATLESATDGKGRSIEVIEIVQPRPREFLGRRITPGYTNHYIANDGVVMQAFGIPEDRTAAKTLAAAYPGREVVVVEAPHLEIGGGGIHCITQQIPGP